MESAVEKYQFKPFIGSSHYWALSQCGSVPLNSKVLDIGCGRGAIGGELKQRGVSELYAVEIDTEAREHVKDIYKKVESSIDSYSGMKFDLILLLDILEHLNDPFEYFKQVNSFLAPQGTILISVPNIAHWSVRLPLLFGSFNYSARGILDRTHFQFFTRKRFRELLCSAPQLKLEELSVSIPPTEFVLPKWVWDNQLYAKLTKCHWELAKLLPGFFGYQHLGRLKLS